MANLTDVNRITLDLSIHRIVNVRCSQDDKNTRELYITITNDGKKITLPYDVSVQYMMTKPDKTVIWRNVDDILSDGTIYINLTDQCTACAGIVHSKLRLMSGEQNIGSMPFNIIIDKPLFSNEEIESSSDLGVLFDAIEKINRTTNEVFVENGDEVPDYLKNGDFYLQEY